MSHLATIQCDQGIGQLDANVQRTAGILDILLRVWKKRHAGGCPWASLGVRSSVAVPNKETARINRGKRSSTGARRRIQRATILHNAFSSEDEAECSQCSPTSSSQTCMFPLARMDWVGGPVTLLAPPQHIGPQQQNEYRNPNVTAEHCLFSKSRCLRLVIRLAGTWYQRRPISLLPSPEFELGYYGTAPIGLVASSRFSRTAVIY